MKRNFKLFALLSAALMSIALFASCGGSPKQEIAAAQPESIGGEATPQATANVPAGGLRELRAPYGFNNVSGRYCYNIDTLFYNGQQYNSIIDMETKQQLFQCSIANCPHGTPDCGALSVPEDMERNNIWVLTQDVIYWLEGGETRPITVSRSNPDGSGMQQLFTLGGELVTYTSKNGSEGTKWSHGLAGGNAVYADDAALYFQVCVTQPSEETEIGFSRHLEVVRAELATGQTSVIFKGEQDSESVSMIDFDMLVGCTEEILLLDIVTASSEGHTGSLSGDINGMHHKIVALPVNGAPQGEDLQVLCEYGEGEFAAKFMENGTLYTVDQNCTRIDAMSLATGERKTILENLPGPEGKNLAYFGPYIDGTLFVSLSCKESEEDETYALDLKTFSLQPVTLSRIYKFGSQMTKVAPIASYGDDYLVAYEERREPISVISGDGQAYVSETVYNLYALISKQDYYAGNPNYREIEMLPR